MDVDSKRSIHTERRQRSLPRNMQQSTLVETWVPKKYRLKACSVLRKHFLSYSLIFAIHSYGSTHDRPRKLTDRNTYRPLRTAPSRVYQESQNLDSQVDSDRNLIYRVNGKINLYIILFDFSKIKTGSQLSSKSLIIRELDLNLKVKILQFLRVLTYLNYIRPLWDWRIERNLISSRMRRRTAILLRKVCPILIAGGYDRYRRRNSTDRGNSSSWPLADFRPRRCTTCESLLLLESKYTLSKWNRCRHAIIVNIFFFS